MKKKLITLSSVALLGVVALIFVAKGVSGGVAAAEDEKFRINNSTLTAYLGTDTFVSIPDTVTIIGEEAFAGNETLTGVDIPDSVSVISYNSFKDCTALEDIVIPDSVTKVGPGAFEGCTALKMANIGTNVSSWGTGVFTNCNNLASVLIDEDNQYLTAYNGAIYNGNMTMLYQVLPARQGDNYVMPDTVKKIDTYAFWNMQNVKNVMLSEKLEVIPSYAMSNMSSVENVVIKGNVSTLERGALANGVNLKQVLVPESVKEIDKTAFANCPKLKILTKKDSYADGFCQNRDIDVIYKKELPTDFIDSNVNLDEKPNVGESNFTGNTGTVVVEGNQDDIVRDNVIKYEENPNNYYIEDTTAQTVFEPYGAYVHPLDVPENDDVVGKTVIVSGNAVVLMNNTEGTVYDGNVTESNFAKNDIVESDTLTESEINKDETEYSDITEVQGGDEQLSEQQNTIVEQKKFYKQQDLTEYTIDDSVVEIGRLAFSESGLKNIIIPDNVMTISYGAFLNCKNLESVEISNKVSDIETRAFEGTPWLNNWKNQKVSETGEEFLVVGDGILLAYRGNSSEVVVPDNVKKIAAEVFKNHSEIVSVEIPNTVTKICADAFRDCKSLKNLKGGDGLITVIRGAFYGTQITEYSN